MRLDALVKLACFLLDKRCFELLSNLCSETSFPPKSGVRVSHVLDHRAKLTTSSFVSARLDDASSEITLFRAYIFAALCALNIPILSVAIVQV